MAPVKCPEYTGSLDRDIGVVRGLASAELLVTTTCAYLQGSAPVYGV